MDDTPRPILDHLEELRWRLIWVFGVWAVGTIIASFWSKELFAILMAPAVNAVLASGHTLIAVSPSELFMTYLKTAILAGFLLAMPVALWHLWAFVAPGLYENERRMALPFVLSTSALFVVGCTFAYFIAFPMMFGYFVSLEADFVHTSWTTEAVFSSCSWMYLAFGLSFQLPIVLVALAVAGVVTPAWFAKQRKYALLIAFIVGAVLTPSPDVTSQMLVSIPLCLLYELSIWVSRALVRPKKVEEPSLLPVTGEREG
jgi:sec-independent protein translocase protein TatC